MEFSRQEYWSGLPFPSARDIFRCRDQTHVSWVSCIGRQILYHWATCFKRRNLDAERDTQMEPHGKTLGKEGHQQAKSALSHQQPGEHPGAGHSLLSSGRQSLVLLTAWCWTSDHQNCELINLCCLSQQVHGTLLQQPSELKQGSTVGCHRKKSPSAACDSTTPSCLQGCGNHVAETKSCVWALGRRAVELPASWKNGAQLCRNM